MTQSGHPAIDAPSPARLFTRGMQGKDLREGVLVCAKHFLSYSVTEAGQNMAATAVGPRELYDVYARPFEAAIRLAGACESDGLVLR